MGTCRTSANCSTRFHVDEASKYRGDPDYHKANKGLTISVAMSIIDHERQQPHAVAPLSSIRVRLHRIPPHPRCRPHHANLDADVYVQTCKSTRGIRVNLHIMWSTTLNVIGSNECYSICISVLNLCPALCTLDIRTWGTYPLSRTSADYGGSSRDVLICSSARTTTRSATVEPLRPQGLLCMMSDERNIPTIFIAPKKSPLSYDNEYKFIFTTRGV